MTNTRQVDFRHLDSAPDPQAGLKYLDAVAALEAAQEYKNQSFEMLEVGPGRTVLEVGCGTGDDVRTLGARVGPSGHVVGLDSSQAAIAEAVRRSAGSSAPVEFRVGDALDLDFSPDEFDGTRADRVFQHLEDPVRALHELVRVTRPGGKVVVCEPDWDTLVVDSPDRQITRQVVRHNADDAVRNGWIGRQLRAMFLNAGLAEVKVSTMMAILTSFALANDLLFLTRTAENAVNANRITDVQAAQWLNHLRSVDRTGSFFASLGGYIVAGRKPE